MCNGCSSHDIQKLTTLILTEMDQPLTSWSAKNARRAQIDAKLTDIGNSSESLLLELRSLRNELAPVSTLPVEIMSEIFNLCHSVDFEDNLCDIQRET